MGGFVATRYSDDGYCAEKKTGPMVKKWEEKVDLVVRWGALESVIVDMTCAYVGLEPTNWKDIGISKCRRTECWAAA